MLTYFDLFYFSELSSDRHPSLYLVAVVISHHWLPLFITCSLEINTVNEGDIQPLVVKYKLLISKKKLFANCVVDRSITLYYHTWDYAFTIISVTTVDRPRRRVSGHVATAGREDGSPQVHPRVHLPAARQGQHLRLCQVQSCRLPQEYVEGEPIY